MTYLQLMPLIIVRPWAESSPCIVSSREPASMPVSRNPDPRGRCSFCAKAATFQEAKHTTSSDTMFRTKSAAMSAGTVEHSSSEPAPVGGAAGGGQPDMAASWRAGDRCRAALVQRSEPQLSTKSAVLVEIE